MDGDADVVLPVLSGDDGISGAMNFLILTSFDTHLDVEGAPAFNEWG